MAEATTSNARGVTSSEGKTADQVLADLELQRRQADQRMRPEVEAQRRQAHQEAQKTLDSEAIAAIQQTERALTAIGEQRIDEALAAIEQATGKISVLLSRNPATALIPVNVQVTVIDTAPQSISDIVFLRDAAEVALDINDLPTTRTLLDSLRSEIRVRTYNLPLATYPVALQRAARLLEEKNMEEAGTVLLVALNTLAVIDQVIPLPLLLAREAINQAQAAKDKDKDAAHRVLEFADDQVVRLMELGYTPDNAEYSALRDEINNLRKQLKGKEDTTPLFSRIKEKVASLTRRQSERKTRSEDQKQQQPKKAA